MKHNTSIETPSSDEALSFLLVGLLACALLALTSCGPGASSTGESKGDGFVEQPPTGPATIAEAAKVIDLSIFPVLDTIDGAVEGVPNGTLANLTYKAGSDVKTGYEFQRKQLTSQHWKELPNTAVTDQYASGTFSRNTFTLSVSVNPDSKPGLVDVSIHNHGNIDLTKLPVPPNVKSVYSGPTTTMYVTEAAVPDTAQLCRDLLLKAGWEPHGTAGDTTSYFRQNAIRLTVTVSSAPAQGGKTMISISPELMSAELPVHPDATEVQYADTLRRLSFLTTAENDALFGFYKIALGKAGWKPNREEAIQVDDKDEMVFRNGDGVLFVEAKKSRANNRYVEVSYTTITEMNAAAERMKKKLAADKEKAGTK